MRDKGAKDKARRLIDEIDERLRDAERLRNHVRSQQPFWPDRRRISRIPDLRHDESSENANRSR